MLYILQINVIHLCYKAHVLHKSWVVFFCFFWEVVFQGTNLCLAGTVTSTTLNKGVNGGVGGLAFIPLPTYHPRHSLLEEHIFPF